MGRVYAVASGKGGVGKTTTVVNLGGVLAASGHETVVVDVDLGMGNVADALGIDESAGATVHDVLAGTASVDEAIREGPAGLRVVPGSAALDDFGRGNPENLGELVDELDDDATVLLDTSAGLSHDSVEPLAVADEVLLVSTPTRGAIRDTQKTGEVARRMETPVAGAVLTRVRGDADVDGVADRLGAAVRGTIPEDEAVGAAAEAGEPLVTFAPDAPATVAYRRLAADLTGDAAVAPVAETGGEGDTEVESEATTEDDGDEESEGDDDAEDGTDDGDEESDGDDGGEESDGDDGGEESDGDDGGEESDGDDGAHESEEDEESEDGDAIDDDADEAPAAGDGDGDEGEESTGADADDGVTLTTPESDATDDSADEDDDGVTLRDADAADGDGDEGGEGGEGDESDEEEDEGGRSGFLGWLLG